MPDIDCGGTRLYEVLRSGRFVLLSSAPAGLDWPGVEQVNHCDATQPGAILVRPDGYVAWATRRVPTDVELAEVLTRWCGGNRTGLKPPTTRVRDVQPRCRA